MMRGFDMLMKSMTLKNQAVIDQTNQVVIDRFNLLPMSYSTADIEKSIFYENKRTPFNLGEPLGEAKMMVVHGVVFALEEGSIPQASVPLTEKSGLFKIIKLVEEPVP